jgi:hypothetical protein
LQQGGTRALPLGSRRAVQRGRGDIAGAFQCHADSGCGLAGRVRDGVRAESSASAHGLGECHAEFDNLGREASSVSRSPVGSAAAASSSAPAASGRAAGGATIAGIDARCAPAEKLAREATSADQIFANVQSTDMDPGTWQRFTSDADLKRKTKDKFVYDGAAVWRARNAWTLVAMTLSSPSGDWVQFVDYCYRPTGTLAKREATLNTFVTGDEVDDGVSRLRTTYVGANGRVLAQRAKVRNLKTLKPAPGRQFMQNDEPEYLTISQLPFAGLLRRAGVPASR